MKIKNKKAYLDEWLPSILALIVIILIIIFFAFKKPAATILSNKIIQEEKERVDAKIKLNAFLSKKVTDYPGAESISDVIAISYLKKDYSYLEKEITEYFNKYYEKKDSWQIEIKTIPENEIISTENMQGENAKICNSYIDSFILGYGNQYNIKGTFTCSDRKTLAISFIPNFINDKTAMFEISLITYSVNMPK